MDSKRYSTFGLSSSGQFPYALKVTSQERADLDIDEQVRRSAVEFSELEPVTLALMLLLYRAQSEVDRAHVEELAPLGLTVPQFNVLSVLHRVPTGLSMRDLSSAVSVRPTNLTSVVHHLHRRELVHRSVNPTDRRSVVVCLTPSGDQLIRELLPGHWRYLQHLLRGVHPADQEALARLLRKLLESVSARDLQGGSGPPSH